MLAVHYLEQQSADVPAGNDWLSPSELARLARLTVPKRRADWRLGRWTAKRALAVYLGLPPHLARIEILAAASGAPEAFIDGAPAAVAVSLTHSGGVAACALAPPAAALGCDIEQIEPRSPAFAADYFTAPEQQWIASLPASRRPLYLALLWSAKESVLKSLRAGLRLDTRSVHVRASFVPAAEDWSPVDAHCGSRAFRGWWRAEGHLVRTLVSDPPPLRPVSIVLPPCERACAFSRA